MWQEEYRNKLVTADEAVANVKSGERVVILGREPLALTLALTARARELENLAVYFSDPNSGFSSFQESRKVALATGYALPAARKSLLQHTCDFLIGGITGAEVSLHNIDTLMLELSTPDSNGFCSFGNSVWWKKQAAGTAKKVLAEVNGELIRTYGENFIHTSKVDCFVEGLYQEEYRGESDFAGREIALPGETDRNIAANVSELVGDGDTLEVGIGNISEWLVPMGILKDRRDLGWHSEVTPRGIISLVRDGVINGERKNINRGKAVATAIGGSKSDLEFVNNNPFFELYGAEYVLDPRVISANDNVLAINSALSIDLTGQIAAESIGTVMMGGPGGQLAFAAGAALSKGGRFVSVLPSTAKDGIISRIVSRLTEGTVITVPRTLADIVVTEYGTALLKGKTQRERALELISIAHPDFRDELRKEAARLFWP